MIGITTTLSSVGVKDRRQSDSALPAECVVYVRSAAPALHAVSNVSTVLSLMPVMARVDVGTNWDNGCVATVSVGGSVATSTEVTTESLMNGLRGLTEAEVTSNVRKPELAVKVLTSVYMTVPALVGRFNVILMTDVDLIVESALCGELRVSSDGHRIEGMVSFTSNKTIYVRTEDYEYFITVKPQYVDRVL